MEGHITLLARRLILVSLPDRNFIPQPFTIDCGLGNALTPMACGQTIGMLQANGTVTPEATFDVKYVADSIVHVAGLPLDVTVLQYTIMYVILFFYFTCSYPRLNRATKMPHVGRG